jgi:hypothetical protein
MMERGDLSCRILNGRFEYDFLATDFTDSHGGIKKNQCKSLKIRGKKEIAPTFVKGQ